LRALLTTHGLKDGLENSVNRSGPRGIYQEKRLIPAFSTMVVEGHLKK
jgi:hypothetical protein